MIYGNIGKGRWMSYNKQSERWWADGKRRSKDFGQGAAYQAEVPLNCRFCYEDLDLLVEGRADGIEEKEDHVMVDEIKGVHRELRFVEEPVPVHLAQARCYAAIYAEQNQL